MVSVNERMRWVDARVHDENLPEILVIDADLLGDVEELVAEAHFRGQPRVLHVFGQFGRLRIGYPEPMRGVITILQRLLHLDAIRLLAAEHGEAGAGVEGVLGVPVVFRAEHDPLAEAPRQHLGGAGEDGRFDHVDLRLVRGQAVHDRGDVAVGLLGPRRVHADERHVVAGGGDPVMGLVVFVVDVGGEGAKLGAQAAPDVTIT